jgi:hypothetical protein
LDTEVIRMMKRSSVFVLLLCLGCTPVSKPKYTIEELTGTYFLVSEDEGSLHELISDDPASGWNYNDPQDLDFYLNPDSTFEMNTRYGDFEGPSYRGKWRVEEDTVYLFEMDHIIRSGLSVPEYSNDLQGLINRLAVEPNGDLHTTSVISVECNRILRRK